MTEGYVRVPEDSTGKKLRTVYSTIGSDEVHNEGVVVVDPTTSTQVMAVDSSGNATVKVNAALPAGTNAIGKLAANTGVDIGDVDVTSLPDVDVNDISKGTQTNDVKVTLDSEAVVLGAGSAAFGKLAANSGVDIGDADVAGRVAHDAGDSEVSIKIGGRADTTFQTAVSDGDKVDALFDVYGQLRTRVDHANNWSYHSDGSSALTDQQVQAAPGAGLSVYITDIIFSTGAATACNIFFEEGASTILGPYYLEATAGRGLSIHFQTPKKCTANTAVTVTTSAAIAQALDVTGFIAP